MRVDLKSIYDIGYNNLLTWRERYSKEEYPEKILLNIFYRKFTIQLMWKGLENSFQKKVFGGRKILWKDFSTGFTKQKQLYEITATKLVQPRFQSFLSKNGDKMIGSCSYNSFKDNVISAKNGDYQSLIELEYLYLYMLLTDECVMIWSALGGTGLSKIDAIGKITGLIIEPEGEIDNYAMIESILGQLSITNYMTSIHNPLPPML